ncbi:hypothetical protein Tco_0678800 [Tanacetum coccineum]|uniref:Uncharacterized protein n=1 Tax=Tanacetum coccineum TaxID=301880 RepID=A0ABQ4XG97_9ASTR
MTNPPLPWHGRGFYSNNQIGLCLELASPKQTALGKDFSNSLMADSLPKTIWLSMYHVVAIKHWLFQSKWLLVFERHIRTGQMLALLRSDTTAAQYLLQAINKQDGPDQYLYPGENQSRLPGISRLKRDYAVFAGYGGKVSTHGKEDKKSS